MRGAKMSLLPTKKPPPNPRGVCERCGGSGQLLRPTESKLLHFKKCSNCQGHGVRFNDDKKLPD